MNRPSTTYNNFFKLLFCHWLHKCKRSELSMPFSACLSRLELGAVSLVGLNVGFATPLPRILVLMLKRAKPREIEEKRLIRLARSLPMILVCE